MKFLNDMVVLLELVVFFLRHKPQSSAWENGLVFGSVSAKGISRRRRTFGTLALEVRLLAVADQFEALTAARPYRDSLSPETALGILWRDAGDGVDPVALSALERFLSTPEAAPLLLPQTLDPEVPVPS